MRISDWSSDVCSSDLLGLPLASVTGLVQQVPLVSPASCENGTNSPFLTGASSGASKSSAILGGSHSKLELISLQQAARDRQSSQGLDRQSVVKGKGVSGRVVLGGRRIIKKNKK